MLHHILLEIELDGEYLCLEFALTADPVALVLQRRRCLPCQLQFWVQLFDPLLQDTGIIVHGVGQIQVDSLVHQQFLLLPPALLRTDFPNLGLNCSSMISYLL